MFYFPFKGQTVSNGWKAQDEIGLENTRKKNGKNFRRQNTFYQLINDTLKVTYCTESGVKLR